MLIPPLKQTYEEIKEAFTAQLLSKVCDDLGLKNAERRSFAKFLITVTAQYVELKKANPDRLWPSKQKNLLRKYGNTLKTAKKLYKKINLDPPTTAKFHGALREEYHKQTAYMQEMLHPYRNASGSDIGAFFDLLDMLIKVSKEAETINIGLDKSKTSNRLLAWWVGEIKLHWPKNSPIAFKLGSFIKAKGRGKSMQSAYDSEACKLLMSLMIKIEYNLRDEMIETAMRKVIAEGDELYPAKFLLK